MDADFFSTLYAGNLPFYYHRRQTNKLRAHFAEVGDSRICIFKTKVQVAQAIDKFNRTKLLLLRLCGAFYNLSSLLVREEDLHSGTSNRIQRMAEKEARKGKRSSLALSLMQS
jgi:hypothetical protein